MVGAGALAGARADRGIEGAAVGGEAPCGRIGAHRPSRLECGRTGEGRPQLEAGSRRAPHPCRSLLELRTVVPDRSTVWAMLGSPAYADVPASEARCALPASPT